MSKIIFAAILINLCSYSQNLDSTSNILYSKKNTLMFADYLFCNKDYLRAANEYLRFNDHDLEEKYIYKLGLSFSAIKDFHSAEDLFNSVNKNSYYFLASRLELMKIHYLEDDYSGVNRLYLSYRDSVSNQKTMNQLYLMASLKGSDVLQSITQYKENFEKTKLEEVVNLYELKINPPERNPLLASILSAVIPGLGKVYSNEISDGIFSFLTTNLLSFLAYDNFKADHRFRGWLFAGLASIFYTGNIYGSYAATQIFNAQVKYDFNLRLDSFLKSNNYFIPDYDFCK